jgi:hypothetical protein
LDDAERFRGCRRDRNIDSGDSTAVLLGERTGGTVDEMGSFRVEVEIENPARPGERRQLSDTLVDTGAELSWFPLTSWSHWVSSGANCGSSARLMGPSPKGGPA